MSWRMRAVVRVFVLANPTGGAGGSRVETLSCGHKWVGKQSVPVAKRRRCRACGECREGA